MDTGSELARERRALVKADTDLVEGEARISAQERLLSDLRHEGNDAREAERLLQLLRDTLFQWREHRVLILQRIAHLEARLGSGDAGIPPPHAEDAPPG